MLVQIGIKSNSIGSYSRRGDWIVVTTSGTCLLSSVKRILQNGQPTRDGVRKIYKELISNSPFGTLDLTASLLVATLHFRHHDRK